MFARLPDEVRKAISILQDTLSCRHIGILKCKVSVWKCKVSRGRQKEQLADTMAGMRSKRTKQSGAQLTKSFAQGGGGRRDSKDRTKKDKPNSSPGNQQINGGTISDADLEGLYYSPGKGQRLVEYKQNWSTQHVSNRVEHQVLSKKKAIEAAVKLARDISTEHSIRIQTLVESIEATVKLASDIFAEHKAATTIQAILRQKNATPFAKHKSATIIQARLLQRKAKRELAAPKMYKAATITQARLRQRKAKLELAKQRMYRAATII
jgi:hypothetical protein